MVEQIGQPGEIPDFLKRSHNGKPPKDLTIRTNGIGDDKINPQELLESVRSLEAHTPQGIRALGRR